MKGSIKLPEISDKDKSPLVEQLLTIIKQQSIIIQQQAEEIQNLKDEIARLKNQPPRPKIKPSSLGKKKSGKSGASRKKRPGSKKRSKTAKLMIHKTKPIEPENIPAGSEFRYYKDFVVQDIKIQPWNTRYRLKVYETPDGGFVAMTDDFASISLIISAHPDTKYSHVASILETVRENGIGKVAFK
jgi:biopolymer transport protein ExbD